MQTRVLLLTQRFTPSFAPRSTRLAGRLVALRGETEGFQLAVRSGRPLRARVGPATDPLLAATTRLLRVGFVRIRRPSSGMRSRRGLYADPLPPQVPRNPGRQRGRWQGFVVLVDVPYDAAPRVYRGTVEVLEGARLIAARDFGLRVSAVPAIERSDPRAFRVVVGVAVPWYRRLAPIADPYRRGRSAAALQLRNLLGFLSAHSVAPVEVPSEAEDDYQRLPWTAKLLPSRAKGFSMRRDWQEKGAGFLASTWQTWATRGWIRPNTYFYVWDEPGGERERREIPAINRLVHRHAPSVKTFMAGTLYVQEGRRSASNRHLWDGGPDDVDAWAFAPFRFYGSWTRPHQHRRLIRQVQRAGKEVWSYTYYMPTRGIPQLVIDGPPADPRLLMLWNAFEGNAGWLTWQLIRWVDGRPVRKRARPRNPYRDTVSWIAPGGVIANGDVSLIYPPVARRYGLTDPTAPPVTSLRFETLRDGIEDANLATLHRERFGPRATRRRLHRIFGRVRVPRGVGWTWPAYRHGGLARRMELTRRRLIADLERPHGSSPDPGATGATRR